MARSDKPLGPDSSIGTWLDHPSGGPILRELLAQAGQNESVLRPMRPFAIKRLVALSQGQMTIEMIEALAVRANSGEAPAVADEPEAEAAEDTGPAPVEPRPFTERIVPGRFDGRTVVVTGSGSGIGRATASRIAREGGRVVAVDVAADRLTDFRAALPDADIVLVTGDIRDDAAVAAIAEAAGPDVDGLANIAGVTDDMTPIHEVSDAVWERMMGINVTGTFKLTRAVLPAMLARGYGSIVNVASEAALRGSAAGAAYTASKHAVVGLTKSGAFMYGDLGIRVNAVAPGAVLTDIESSFGSPLGARRLTPLLGLLPSLAEPEMLAASITFLLSDDGVNVNGAILPSDGGWSVQ